MTKRLKIALIEGWEDISAQNPGGPSTFLRPASDTSGLLQISVQAEYRSGKKPDPTPQQLVGYACGMIEKAEASIKSTLDGKCRFGHFGAAEGRFPPNGFMRAWVIADGFDFLVATHISKAGRPDEPELQEAHAIVANLDYK